MMKYQPIFCIIAEAERKEQAMDSKFKAYQKMTITEIRPYEEGEQLPESVDIASFLLMNGSPKAGDMICRNRSNHDDVWLVDQEYFKRHYLLSSTN